MSTRLLVICLTVTLWSVGWCRPVVRRTAPQASQRPRRPHPVQLTGRIILERPEHYWILDPDYQHFFKSYWALDPASGKESRIAIPGYEITDESAEHNLRYRDVLFSPDGKLALFTSDHPNARCPDDVLRLANLVTGEVRVVPAENEVEKCQFSKDSRWIYKVDGEQGTHEGYAGGKLSAYEVATGRSSEIAPNLPIECFAVAHNGRIVLDVGCPRRIMDETLPDCPGHFMLTRETLASPLTPLPPTWSGRVFPGNVADSFYLTQEQSILTVRFGDPKPQVVCTIPSGNVEAILPLPGTENFVFSVSHFDGLWVKTVTAFYEYQPDTADYPGALGLQSQPPRLLAAAPQLVLSPDGNSMASLQLDGLHVGLRADGPGGPDRIFPVWPSAKLVAWL